MGGWPLVPLLPAHGIGSRADLPLPFGLTVAAAAVVLVVSFLLLAVLWREPRLDGGTAGRPLPRGVVAALGSRWLRATAAGAGLLLTGWVLVAMLWGPQDARNPLPFVVYVLLWVGLVPLSLLLGPSTWARLNPVRTTHALLCRLARVDPRQGVLALPDSWGWWPGALAVLAFVWLELVAPDNTEVGTLRLVVLVYLVVQLLAGFLLGSGWFARGDAFEVWSSTFGRLSPLGRRDDGTLVLRSPLAGPDQVRPEPGLVALVVVILGSTAYDSVREHPRYVSTVQALPVWRWLADTAGLLGVLGVVGVALVLASWAAARVAGRPVVGTATLFAPSVIPVALGYVVAHYYSLLVLEGQNAVLRLADPLALGWSPLGLGGRVADPSLVSPGVVAGVQVAVVVLGHVLGVVLAHDRAVRLFPGPRAALSQVPLLLLMVLYTCGGLLLLFAA
ncbi:hypothetical protein [Thalassiella azotivora]